MFTDTPDRSSKYLTQIDMSPPPSAPSLPSNTHTHTFSLALFKAKITMVSHWCEVTLHSEGAARGAVRMFWPCDSQGAIRMKPPPSS